MKRRHFSDYSVHKMQQFLKRRVAILRDGHYYKCDDATGDYTRKVESNQECSRGGQRSKRAFKSNP